MGPGLRTENVDKAQMAKGSTHSTPDDLAIPARLGVNPGEKAELTRREPTMLKEKTQQETIALVGENSHYSSSSGTGFKKERVGADLIGFVLGCKLGLAFPRRSAFPSKPANLYWG